MAQASEDWRNLCQLDPLGIARAEPVEATGRVPESQCIQRPLCQRLSGGTNPDLATVTLGVEFPSSCIRYKGGVGWETGCVVVVPRYRRTLSELQY